MKFGDEGARARARARPRIHVVDVTRALIKKMRHAEAVHARAPGTLHRRFGYPRRSSTVFGASDRRAPHAPSFNARRSVLVVRSSRVLIPFDIFSSEKLPPLPPRPRLSGGRSLVDDESIRGSVSRIKPSVNQSREYSRRRTHVRFECRKLRVAQISAQCHEVRGESCRSRCLATLTSSKSARGRSLRHRW